MVTVRYIEHSLLTMLFCKDDRLHHPDEVRLTQGSLIVTSSVTILPIYNVVYVQRHILLGSASVSMCMDIAHK